MGMIFSEFILLAQEAFSVTLQVQSWNAGDRIITLQQTEVVTGNHTHHSVILPWGMRCLRGWLAFAWREGKLTFIKHPVCISTRQCAFIMLSDGI